LKKRIKGSLDLEARFWQKVEQFIIDPFDPSWKTHKLSGKLKDIWSFSVKAAAFRYRSSP
jgi:mRNA-degrading endonuclease YafQ of YafQ-DinJ toxin-antitoxin module